MFGLLMLDIRVTNEYKNIIKEYQYSEKKREKIQQNINSINPTPYGRSQPL